MSDNINERDHLHEAVCQAMALINKSTAFAGDEEGLRAKNILREALFNYKPIAHNQNAVDDAYERCANIVEMQSPESSCKRAAAKIRALIKR